jgi:hypothetical protein
MAHFLSILLSLKDPAWRKMLLGERRFALADAD